MASTRRSFVQWLSAAIAAMVVAPIVRSETRPVPPTQAPPATSIPIPELPAGWQAVGYAVLSDGALAILGADVDLRSEWRYNDDGRLVGRPYELAATASAQIFVFDGARLALEARFPMIWPHLNFDRFPDGRWLAAFSRTRGEANGRLLAGDGGELGRIHLGDGIEHIKIDELGLIWVGWFDEGVFGNDGWQVGDRRWPPSSNGLAAFDDGGNVITVAEGAPAGLEIADCYALNVAGSQAWACTYSGFPIVRCSAAAASKWWSTELSGAKALAVLDSHVLVAGGYNANANRVVLFKLDGDNAVAEKEWCLPIEASKIRELNLFDGRNSEIHAVHEGMWHRWQIGDFLADASAS